MDEGGEDGGAAADQGVLAPPRDPDGPGEMGKAVVLPKTGLTADQKKLIDDGWQRNAFNQYVSDMISVHRTLADPRDDKSVPPPFPPFSFFSQIVNQIWIFFEASLTKHVRFVVPR